MALLTPLRTPVPPRRTRSATIIARALFVAVLAVVGVLLYLAAVRLPQFGTGSANRVQDSALAARLARLLKQNPDLVLPKTIERLQSEVAEDGFTLLALPAERSAKPGETATFTVHVVRGSAFTAPVGLSLERTPTETTADVAPSPVPAGADVAVASITLGKATQLGKYSLTLVGEAAGAKKMLPISLIVTNISAANIAVRDVRPMDVGNRWQTTVTWTTDVAANSWVEYAPQDSFITDGQTYSYTAKSNATEPTHSIVLRNLEPDTVYHYRIKSVDAQSNVIVGDDAYFVTSVSTGT